MLTLKLNPTVTGGTDAEYTYAGYNGQRHVFVSPANTHLNPQRLEMSASGPTSTKSDIGTASAIQKLTFGTREEQEGCCGVIDGYVIADLKLRWNLNQPESVLDDAIEALRAWVNNPVFVSTIKTGVIPT